MPKLVVHGAGLKCSEGTSPGTLSVLPVNMASGDDAEAATVNDCVPFVNIPMFGMCKTQANPQVAAATSAVCGLHHRLVEPHHLDGTDPGRVVDTLAADAFDRGPHRRPRHPELRRDRRRCPLDLGDPIRRPLLGTAREHVPRRNQRRLLGPRPR